MKVAVLYNEPLPGAGADDQDVLVQRDAVLAALHHLGHFTVAVGCTLNLEAVKQELLSKAPDVVFNLVESLGGSDRLMPLVPQLLESLCIPFTGAAASAIQSTSNKVRAKQLLQAASLPTPAWHAGNSQAMPGESLAGKWIIKPVWEHASLGMDDNSVVTTTSTEQLRELVRNRTGRLRTEHFAEQFIAGREFNLSLLNGKVLPPAEIDFSAFPEGKPRIVGHDAKWNPDSFEYHQTPRTFEFTRADAPLLRDLANLAERCWQAFSLRGFARVDFRVDEAGKPFILEINVNPCLAPDAGFAAALNRAGIGFAEAIQHILSDV